MWTAIVLGLGLVLLVAVVAVRFRRQPTTPAKSVTAVEPAIEGGPPLPGPVQRGRPLPVMLVHGPFGFDRIGVPGPRFDYLCGIARDLETL